MANYHKVNGHWEVIEASREREQVDVASESQAMNDISTNMNMDKLKTFVRQDSPADFLLKLFVPRYYNDGSKVSADVIADIMAKISEALGGASTWAGKGYWTENNILYEDKNIYVEILLKGMMPERATMLGKYLSSVIALALKQEASLYILTPALAEFVSKEKMQENIDTLPKDAEGLNKDEDNFKEDNNI